MSQLQDHLPRPPVRSVSWSALEVITSPTSSPKVSSSSPTTSFNKNDRKETFTIVIGIIEDSNVCQEILSTINNNGFSLKSYYHRKNDNCVFLNFLDESQAQKTKQIFDKLEFYGKTLKACSPIEYFGNEEDAHPGPKKSSYIIDTISLSPSIATLTNEFSHPSTTIVLKNIKEDFRQDQLPNLLSQLSIYPEKIDNYLDALGNFRNMVFIKFKDIESAHLALVKLSKVKVNDKHLKVEFKKRTSSNSSSFNESRSLSSDRVDLHLDRIVDDINTFITQDNSRQITFFPLSVEEFLEIDKFSKKYSLYCHVSHSREGLLAVVSKVPLSSSTSSSNTSSSSNTKSSTLTNYDSFNESDNSFNGSPFRRTKSAPKTISASSLSVPSSLLLSSSPRMQSAPVSNLSPRGSNLSPRGANNKRSPRGPNGTRGFGAERTQVPEHYLNLYREN